MRYELWDTAEKLNSCRTVELSHPLDNTSPYWDGMPKGVVELAETLIDYDEMDLRIQTFKFPGQFGTHIDYPAHFIRDARLAGGFSIDETTMLPLCVIDVSEKVAQNPDYEITKDDILEFEEKYGRIPEGSFVAMRTDWSLRWPDPVLLANADEDGNEHFPGWTVPVLKFLYEERGVAGTGHETLDTDSAVGCAKAGDLIAERYVLGRDAFQVEVMTNLDKLPPAGSLIFIAAPRFSEANGLPARVWALVPQE